VSWRRKVRPDQPTNDLRPRRARFCGLALGLAAFLGGDAGVAFSQPAPALADLALQTLAEPSPASARRSASS
jgi:hypothetical protein